MIVNKIQRNIYYLKNVPVSIIVFISKEEKKNENKSETMNESKQYLIEMS